MGLSDLLAALEQLPTEPKIEEADTIPSEFADDLAELERVFTEALPSVFPGWESRRQQIAMARTVLQAILEGKAGLVEAGTGTGKSLALLAPAVHVVRKNGGPVIVSTGTHVLQEQYVEKDVPTLQKAMGDFKVAVAKGRGNYLCLKRLDDEAKQLTIGDDPIDELEKWAQQTKTGDRAELPPRLSDWWPKVNADDSCIGSKCPLFDQCFFYKARRAQQNADVVIANHALLMADIVVRENSYGNASLLPDAKAVIIDEAHHLETAARQGFGIQLTPTRFRRLLSDARRVAPLLDPSIIRDCESAHDDFFAKASTLTGDDRSEIDLAGLELSLLAELDNLTKALKAEQARSKSEQERDDVENLITRLDRFSVDVDTLANPGDNYVVWIEKQLVRGQGRVTIQATPIDVAKTLRYELFTKQPVICSSATMTTNREFGYFRQATGAPKDALEYVTDSPFDYERQSLLYIPFDLPDPKADDYHERIAGHVLDILRATEGRAFVLSTSWRGMRTLFDLVAPHLGHRCLAQGEIPRHLLIDEFKKDKHSVLFATASFWEGVDVQGDALSAVIVDRLPFAFPHDPVTRAKVRAIEAAGGNSFADYSLPEAVLRLRQGFGRLIRNQNDRGVVAIMDRRIVQSRYGRLFLNSLPPARMVRRISDVERFFGEGTT